MTKKDLRLNKKNGINSIHHITFYILFQAHLIEKNEKKTDFLQENPNRQRHSMSIVKARTQSAHHKDNHSVFPPNQTKSSNNCKKKAGNAITIQITEFQSVGKINSK